MRGKIEGWRGNDEEVRTNAKDDGKRRAIVLDILTASYRCSNVVVRTTFMSIEAVQLNIAINGMISAVSSFRTEDR
jgi:hypothetical protein